ncbi:MAG: hypothetical protein ACRCU6_03540, partial [Fusobacteriaceae bacterium]
MLDRYKKIKTEVIDKLVAEDKHCENYTLCTIQDRLSQVADTMETWELEREIEDLEDRLKHLALYQDLQFKKMQLKARQDLRKVSEDLVLEYMIKNDIKKVEWHDKVIEVQNRKSVETEVE